MQDGIDDEKCGHDRGLRVLARDALYGGARRNGSDCGMIQEIPPGATHEQQNYPD